MRLTPDELKNLDKIRGPLSRSRWIREAIAEKNTREKPTYFEQSEHPTVAPERIAEKLTHAGIPVEPEYVTLPMTEPVHQHDRTKEVGDKLIGGHRMFQFECSCGRLWWGRRA